MNKVYLKNNGVYFFIGDNSEEKTECLENILFNNDIKTNSLFDIHDIRRFIFGDHYTYDLEDEGIYQISYNFEDFSLIETLLNIITMRSKQGLLTLVDIEELNDRQLKKLTNYFLNEKIDFSFFNYNKKILNKKDINDNTLFEVKSFELTHANIDVIGDIHGLYTDFVSFIESLGYTVKDYTIYHKENRKILFLGDVVDRGQESLKMLKIMYNSVKYNGHYAIIGNHENKLSQFYKHYSRFKNIPPLNEANSETILEFLSLSTKEQEDYIDFIENLPHYYVYQDLAFIHGNIDYFEPKSVLKSKMMYGAGKEDATDLKYQKLYNEGLNKFTIFHGHYSQDDDFENVFSLERKQAYAGELAIIPLDSFLNDSKVLGNRESFNKNLKTYKCSFDFDQHCKKFEFRDKFEEYSNNGFLSKEYNKEKSFILYKYSGKIDNSNMFIFDDVLLNSNGIIFDFSGNVVCNPSKKIFNYKNLPNKNFYLNKSYIFREKISGYNFNISYNKLEDKIFISSSQYIYDKKISFIVNKIKDNFYSELLKFCKEKSVTLSICYSKNQFYLVDIKECKMNSKYFKENEIDLASFQIGYLKRPKYFTENIQKIMDDLNNTKKTSGYVVKNLEDEDCLFYIENNASDYFKFLRSLNKEEKIAISTGNLYKIKPIYNNLCKFINSKNHFRTKIFSLRENDIFDILKDFNY